MSETRTQSHTLQVVIRDGVAEPLEAAGFERVGRKQRWMRQTPELVHIVVVAYRHGSYAVEFLLGCPPAAVILSGEEPADASDPNFAIAAGAASDFRDVPRLYGFKLKDGMASEEVAKLAEDANDDSAAIAAWLGRFQTRADLCKHLLQTRGAGFRWPAGQMGLVDLTAATLAVIDHAANAAELLEAAEARWRRLPDDERMARLRGAAGV